MESPLYKIKPGVHYRDRQTNIAVWAPEKKKMSFVCKEKKMLLPLRKTAWGYWQATTDILQPGDRYTFLIDDTTERPDPASLAQPDGVHSPSMIVDTDFPWKDEAWHGVAMNDLIIYELHVGAYTPEHHFEGVIRQLPYLKELGITAIELMPVAQFPGERNWGYDGVYIYAVQQSYGGLTGLQKLVDAAHAIGISVILDVVYNHVGPEGNYLADFAPYFTDVHKTPWGDAFNFDQAHCDGVRNYFIQNVLFWLDSCHIDGLRLDAVHAIKDLGSLHILEQMHIAVTALSERVGVRKFLIVESDLNNPRYIKERTLGGYGMNAQWADDFHHALHALLTKENNGYYADFGTIQHLAKAFTHTFIYNGDYSEHRKKTFGQPVENLPFCRFVVCSQNHDQVGNRLKGERLSTMLNFEQLKLAAATVLLSPHIPLLFMGEETCETNPFLFFVHHSDEKLIDIIQRERKKEFSSFGYTDDFNNPQEATTFEESSINWEYEAQPQRDTLYRYYQALIHFRKQYPVITHIARNDFAVRVHEDKLLILEYREATGTLCILLNFSATGSDIQDITGEKLFDSTDPQWQPEKETGNYAGIAPYAVQAYYQKNEL